MIVDLVRNDLGRVALTGTVTVPELLVVRPAPGVWHLVSTVSARVGVGMPMASDFGCDVPARIGDRHAEGEGPSAADWLGAAPPRECIAAQSVWRRPSQGCELNVAIRTVEFDAARQRGARRRRRHHRRFRSRPRMGRVPAQGRAHHRE